MTTAYLDKPEQWDAVVKACYERGVVGLDTETFGHNVKESTPAYRAKIDVWSLALSTGRLHPRGYHIARGCVLPLEAALHPPMRDMLGAQNVLHVFHNAHHDQHTFANYGIQLGAIYDTLDAARLAWPGLESGYSLKPLRVSVLGKADREKFATSAKSRKEGAIGLTDPLEVQYQVAKEVKECACGEPKCRKTAKKWGEAHEKGVTVQLITKTRKEACPIESIVPGHPRWARKLDYAGDDAVDGLELYEMVTRRLLELEKALPELPW